MPFWVYVLANPDGETYVGQTADLDRRLTQHNAPAFAGTFHTKRHSGPWRVLYREEAPTRQAAMVRERQLKSGGGRRFISSLLRSETQDAGC